MMNWSIRELSRIELLKLIKAFETLNITFQPVGHTVVAVKWFFLHVHLISLSIQPGNNPAPVLYLPASII